MSRLLSKFHFQLQSKTNFVAIFKNFFTLSTANFRDYFSLSLGAIRLIYYSIKAAKSKL